MESHTKPPEKHLGRKIGRMREILGIKQDVVADKLGISQSKVSYIEQSEEVDDATLEEIAGALGVKPEAIKSFSDEATMNFIQNNYEGTTANNSGSFYQCTFNPVDKLMEAIDKNEKLYGELLKSEREKVALLEKLLDKK